MNNRDVFGEICSGKVRKVSLFAGWGRDKDLVMRALLKKGVRQVEIGTPQKRGSVFIMSYDRMTDEALFLVSLALAFRAGCRVVVIHNVNDLRITPPLPLTVAKQLDALLVGSSRRATLFS